MKSLQCRKKGLAVGLNNGKHRVLVNLLKQVAQMPGDLPKKRKSQQSMGQTKQFQYVNVCIVLTYFLQKVY